MIFKTELNQFQKVTNLQVVIIPLCSRLFGIQHQYCLMGQRDKVMFRNVLVHCCIHTHKPNRTYAYADDVGQCNGIACQSRVVVAEDKLDLLQ